jgi:hypothetical protein
MSLGGDGFDPNDRQVQFSPGVPALSAEDVLLPQAEEGSIAAFAGASSGVTCG